MSLYRLTRKLHRWCGLAAGGWLAVLALTGIVLTHPEWRWPHHVQIPGLAPPASRIGTHAHDRMPRIAVDPAAPGRMLAGGLAGLWHREAAGAAWIPVRFDGLEHAPQVFRLLTDPQQGWRRLWVATDDGLWQMSPDGARAFRVALAGERVTALSFGWHLGELGGVVDQSAIFRLPLPASPDELPSEPQWLDLRGAAVAGLPRHVSVNRYGFDLHLGTGFFGIPFSRIVNDVAGVALTVLAVTGFLYWYLPRRWRATRGTTPPSRKRATMQWLFRSHAVVSGVLVALPLLYLSATGIFLDHKLWFQRWSERLAIPAAATTGNYRLDGWAGEILAIGAAPSRPGSWRMMTRLGFLDSGDDGRSWRFDATYPLDLARSWTRTGLHALGDGRCVIASELIARNFVRCAGEARWRRLPDLPGYAVLDAQSVGDSLYVRTYAGLVLVAPGRTAERLDFDLPASGGLDFAYLARVIHGLLVFDRKLIWANDVAAALSIWLMISGLYNWASRKTLWI